MNTPARLIRLLGQAEHRDEGEVLLTTPGDAVLIRRGVLRSFLMKCPDGCGETLAVNLDPRTGKAWWYDGRGGEPTLFPSVWREGGCRSHFIVWRGRILWCDRFEGGNREPPSDVALERRVLAALSGDRLRSSAELAVEIDEIPWEVTRAAQALVRDGSAIAGTGERRDWFARK